MQIKSHHLSLLSTLSAMPWTVLSNLEAPIGAGPEGHKVHGLTHRPHFEGQMGPMMANKCQLCFLPSTALTGWARSRSLTIFSWIWLV